MLSIYNNINALNFSGIKKIQKKDSKGNTYDITFEDGELKSSTKNGKPYKTYQTNPVNSCGNYVFKDSSEIPYEHYWHINQSSIKKIQNHENNTTCNILTNKNNCFNNEPKVFCCITTDDKTGKEIKHNKINLNDIEEVEFNSIEEAKEYFQQEYGINAEFSTIFQAYVVKQAVDTAISHSLNDENKKLFEGLKISNAVLAKDEFAKTTFDFDYYPLYKFINKSDEEKIKYLENSPSAKIIPENIEILLNPEIEWNFDDTKADYDNNFHPYYFYSSQLAHELVHYLHAKNTPNEYYIACCKTPSADEQKIMQEVSVYGDDLSEFVAEYAAGRFEGKTFSKEADELYKKYKGPNLFND